MKFAGRVFEVGTKRRFLMGLATTVITKSWSCYATPKALIYHPTTRNLTSWEKSSNVINRKDAIPCVQPSVELEVAANVENSELIGNRFNANVWSSAMPVMPPSTELGFAANLETNECIPTDFNANVWSSAMPVMQPSTELGFAANLETNECIPTDFNANIWRSTMPAMQPSTELGFAASLETNEWYQSGFNGTTMRNYTLTNSDLPTIEPIYQNDTDTVVFPFGDNDQIVIKLEPESYFPSRNLEIYPKIQRKRASESWGDSAGKGGRGKEIGKESSKSSEKEALTIAVPPFQRKRLNGSSADSTGEGSAKETAEESSSSWRKGKNAPTLDAPPFQRKQPNESWFESTGERQWKMETAEESTSSWRKGKNAPALAAPPFQPIQFNCKSAFRTERKSSARSDQSSGSSKNGAGGSRSVGKENVPPASRPYFSRSCKQMEPVRKKGNMSRAEMASGVEPHRNVIKLNPKYKTEKCVNYPMGYCKFGDNCAFIHDKY